MHPRKIQAGEVDEGVVTGKDDLVRFDAPLRRENGVSLHALGGRALVDRQLIRQRIEKFQRMELRLPRKTHRAADAQR